MLGSYQLDLDFYHCRDDPQLFTSAETASRILNLISEAGFEVCSHAFVNFPESDGFTLVVIIAESYVAVSTWPEYQYVQLTISSCNYRYNNSPKARALERFLRKLYKPKFVVRKPQRRGPLRKYLKK